MSFVLLVDFACVLAFLTSYFDFSSALSQFVLRSQVSKMGDLPPMDVIDKELWVLIKKRLAKFHEFLGAYAFDLTNVEVKAQIFVHEEIQLVLLITELTKFFQNVFEIHLLVFCDLLQFTSALCFSQDIDDTVGDFRGVTCSFLFDHIIVFILMLSPG